VGRIAEARAIISTMSNAQPVVRVGLARTVARYQLREALAKGDNLREIVQEDPDIDSGLLHLTALNLLGQNVDGVPIASSPNPPGPVELAVVADIAALIVEQSEGKPPEIAQGNLVNAANLFALVGDSAGVQRSIQRMPPGDGVFQVSEQAFEVGGVEIIMAHLDQLGPMSFVNLLNAASAARDPELAMALIERAYTLEQTKERWPDFGGMQRTVLRSRELGYGDLALHLARDMAALASETRFPFEAFANLDAAHALLDAGAGPDEVSEALDRAEGLMPTDPDTHVAIGMVSGVMAWEASGLKDEAMATLAYLRARLGEIALAKRALEQVDDPLNWHGLDDAYMPRPAIDAILDLAALHMDADNHAFLVGQTIRMASVLERPATDHEWARRQAKRLFETGEPKGEHANAINSAIAFVASQVGDEALKAAALDRMARRALDSRDPTAIIEAGVQFEVLGRARKPR
jgi:hypothetical protein